MELAPSIEEPEVSSPLKYSTLEQLLDDYRQNGVDSEGHFTIDPRRARELLKQFQLPEPAHYVLHIVSFLIGAGATSVSVSSSRGGLLFEAPGALVAEETVRNPFSVLLGKESRAHLSEFALGLNTLLGQGGARAELSFDRWTGKYEPNSINVRNIPVTTMLTITTSPRLGGKGQDRELELIKEWFSNSPVPIKLNGATLASSRSENAEIGLEIFLRNSKYPLALRPDSGNRIIKDVKAPFGALIRIWRGRSSIRVIHLGRTYEQGLPWSFYVPGWQVQLLINTDQFRKDLSQQEILRNDRYANLVSYLRQEVEKAGEYLLLQLPQLPGTGDLVDDLVGRLFQSDKRELAVAYQRKLVASLDQGAPVLTRGRAVLRLGLMEKSMDSGREYTPGEGEEILNSVKHSQVYEPQWSILKARMALEPESQDLRVAVGDYALRNVATDEMKERCYRWLLSSRHGHLKDKLIYRVELAQFAFRTGRFAEALDFLEYVHSGPQRAHLQESVEFSILAAKLHGEVAAEFGYIEKAIEMFARHLELLRQRHGQYSLKLGLTLERLAYLLEGAGQTKQAKEYRAWSRRLCEG